MNTLIIGVGGTGAKIVEALVHLAPSNNAPHNIFTLLVDQDDSNGNVGLCRESLNNYRAVRDELKECGKEGGWAFCPVIKFEDELLPLKPDPGNNNFAAAIGLASMERNESLVVRSLYTKSQLGDHLEVGYKKRAHMGSILIRNMLKKQRAIAETEIGLKKFKAELLSLQDAIQVVICGSIFGGTGTAGIVPIGRFCKEIFPANTVIKAIMMTPYFKLSDKYPENNRDKGLVRSTYDMQIVKIFLEMYRKAIEETFHHVFLLGSDLGKVVEDNATPINVSGGEEQKNPAHVFEMIAATAVLREDKPGVRGTEYHKFTVDAPIQAERISKEIIPDLTIKLEPIPDLKTEPIRIIQSLANLLRVFDNELSDDWKERQPWIYRENLAAYGKMAQWARRHHAWWREMEGKDRVTQWRHFMVQEEPRIDRFILTSLLSKSLKDYPRGLESSLLAINSLAR